MKRPHQADDDLTGVPMSELGTPLDPAFVIGWHVGKAAADRAARELVVAVSEVWGKVAA